MSYGFIDTSVVDLGANIDLAYVEGLRTRAGVEFPEILSLVTAQVQAANASLDPFVASLLAPPTTESYNDGTGIQPFDVQPGLEYGVPRPQSTDLVQYPLPLQKWQASLGWTEDGLQDMSRARIATDLTNFRAGWAMRHRKEALRRLFSIAEFSVGKNTTSLAPGFAGSGTGLNVFANNYPDGTATAGSYSLYYRIASGSLATGLLAAVTELRRWQQGPFDLVAPQAMIDAVSAINPGNAVTGFVAANPNLVNIGSGTAGSTVDPTMYAGVLFGDVRVRLAITDFSSAHIAIYKSYGALAPMNPLAWRYDAVRGRGIRVKSRSLSPLDQAWGEQWFGLGVNNRTGALLVYVAGSGSYTDPVIS